MARLRKITNFIRLTSVLTTAAFAAGCWLEDVSQHENLSNTKQIIKAVAKLAVNGLIDRELYLRGQTRTDDANGTMESFEFYELKSTKRTVSEILEVEFEATFSGNELLRKHGIDRIYFCDDLDKWASYNRGTVKDGRDPGCILVWCIHPSNAAIAVGYTGKRYSVVERNKIDMARFSSLE